MEKSNEKSVTSGNSINSKLRYPLRSSLRSKEGKPPVPDFSASSVPRRGRVASAVSQSTTVLDLSGKKSVDRTKPPPRRLSIPNKPTSSSSVKSVSSSITSVSETKVKRSSVVRRSLNETPVKKVEDLSSSVYWLSHVKLAESVKKHSIALGFFKLALHAGCEPIDQMKQELKSYAFRNNLDGLGDAMKELSELYDIADETKEVQILETETSRVVAEEIIAALNNDNDSNITSEITKDEDSTVVERVEEEEILDGRTRISLDEINVNQEVVQESEDVTVVVEPADEKRVNKKETVSKKNQPARTKKSVATNGAKTRAVPENKSVKKDERITKTRSKKIQEETKKPTRKPVAKEGEVKSVKQMKKMENKENSVVVDAGEEVQA